jgi:hypothetical protein
VLDELAAAFGLVRLVESGPLQALPDTVDHVN